MKLSPRLQALADWIEPGSRLADIGTDHGLLPVYCVLSGLTVYTAACDIREQPLMSARRNALENGVGDRIEFILCSGLDRVKEGSVDTVIAAGMGGETIVSILDAAKWLRNEGITLLLQPQSKTLELQQWLAENGYYTEKARLVRDSGRIYLLMRVRWDGGCRKPDPYCLEQLAPDGLRKEYAGQLLRRCEKQLLAFRDEADGSAEKGKLTELRALFARLSEDD